MGYVHNVVDLTICELSQSHSWHKHQQGEEASPKILSVHGDNYKILVRIFLSG
jgi:hypothetical protein